MGKRLFYFLSILLIVILLAISSRKESLIGLTSAVVLLVVFFYYFQSLIKKSDKWWLPIVYFVLISFLFIFTSLSSETIVSCLLFLSMITIWPTYRIIKIKQPITILLIYLCVSAIMLYLSTTSNAYRAVYNVGSQIGIEYTGQYLTLGFNNPNEAGIVLYYVISIFMCLILTCGKTIRIVLMVPLALLIYLLIKTGCRSSFISLVLVFLFYYFNRNDFSILNKKTVLWILLLLPLLFAILYPVLAVYYANSNLEVFGKPIFSGRDTLFTEELSYFWNYPIFGDMSKYRFSNALNGYLAILFNTGLIGFAIYLLSIFSVLKTLTKEIVTKSQFFAYLSIIGTYLIASSESVLLIGGGRWYIFMLTLFVLANNNIQEINNVFSRKNGIKKH